MVVYMKKGKEARWIEADEVVLTDEELWVIQPKSSGQSWPLAELAEYTIYGPGGVCLDAEEGDLDIPEK